MTILYPIFSIFFVSIFSVFTAEIDAEHINNGQYIKDHRSRFKQRFYAMTPFLLVNPMYFLASGMLFWVVFEIALNLMIKQKPFYIGNTADTDKFFRKHVWLHRSLKVICLTGAFVLYFYEFLN